MNEAAIAKLTNDRVRLIQAIRDTIPFATENGDGDALQKILDMIISDPCSHFLSYSQEKGTAVSYADKPEYMLDNNHRRRTTLGRYIRRVLAIPEQELSSAGLTLLMDKIFGTLALTGDRFQIVTGKDILQAYHDCYGGPSCMTEYPIDNPISPLQVYAINPDKVALVLYAGPGLPESAHGYARALLWTCDDGTRVLDRIYPDDKGSHVEAMHAWADSHQYAHRVHQGMPGDPSVPITEDRICEVTLKKTPEGRMPYLDTFHWGIDHGGTFCVTNTNEEQEHEFDGTGGGYSELEPEERFAWFCGSCGRGMDETDECVSVLVDCDESHEDWCGECADAYSVTCDRCGEHMLAQRRPRGDRVSTDVNGDHWCPSCVENHASRCDCCDSVVPNDEIFTSEANETLCSDCARTCQDCDGIFRKSELVNGRCPKCAEAQDKEDE